MTAALDEFRDLLKRSIGLDAGSIGISAIERAVQTRQQAFDGCDRNAYWERLRGGGDELQALIEAVVVPETWFFRDPEAFSTIARAARERWALAPRTTIRLLSAPSSTGEEPYSLAMALLDVGVPADRFRIDAIDVSIRVLACAEQATYGRNSFRAKDLAFRDRHFTALAQGYHLNDNVRRQVHFQPGNVLADDFLPEVEVYDAIFCRNLLIYFDCATQVRAISVLNRLLKANGTLFVAPSETGVLLNSDFESAKVPLAFAFYKRAARESAPIAPRRTSVAASRPAAAAKVVRTPAQRVAPLEADSSLMDAVRLADLGRFAEAATCCDEHMRKNGPSAGVFHLKGLLCDSAGDPVAASSFYRKALYLDPAHYETLIHFALLLEQQGDVAGAKVLRDRARRHGQASGNESGKRR